MYLIELYLTELLEKNLRWGKLNLILPSGKTYRFGQEGPQANWLINSERSLYRIARDAQFELGETYISGGWDVVDCELRDLLAVLRANFQDIRSHAWQPLLSLLQQWNRITQSYRNVAHHYDLDEEFFGLFLDREMHYSCAYFPHEDCSLEEAQRAKCDLIVRKLLLQPGQRVLDIGCGWGSLALHLAEHYDVYVVGITLSQKQLDVANQRAGDAKLADKVRFELCDYREHQSTARNDQYDRIVSVGMFEHVGKPFYATYFNAIQRLLRDDGIALVHRIGRSTLPGQTNPWIRKYIFPGGYIPALSEMSLGIEQARLMLSDLEILRMHYAYTLQEWARRFSRNRDKISNRMGERFCRTWEFYLNACEVSFRYSNLVVFQAQLTKQHGSVPTTRDYLF